MKAGDVKPRRRKLTAEEHTLWSRITRSVAPLRRQPVLAATAPAPASLPPSKTKPTPSPHPHPPSRDKLPPPKPPTRLEPFDRRVKQRLARGSEPIEARIDLHGRTQDEAHVMLLRFLRRAQDEGVRFALVITGKGARARDEWSERGVLKRQVPLWLKLPEFRAYVVGFESAHVGHGGEGALYVRIKKPGDRRRKSDR
jgi:DNA-nicking Smr family endonuclease